MTFILLSAVILEACFGYPQWLYARIRHPVVWMGALIAGLERNFNRPELNRRVYGVITMVVVVAVTWAVAYALTCLGSVIAALAVASLLAVRSLFDHVYDVYDALVANDLPLARASVGRIVGRDVEGLDEAGVSRAAIESLAESFCDGVVAPFLWAACLGLPGIACYKAINTADSMIGHKDERYRDFGWAAARLDDAANWIPARLSGVLIACASSSRVAWKVMWRDAGKHASPNAGWPEAAMAGALGLRLGGANSYDGVVHESPSIGEGDDCATAAHLRRALTLYVAACIMLVSVWLVLRVFL